MRLKIILVLLAVSILLPMAIGALRGVGLSRAADDNQTFPFAESYFNDLIDGSDSYLNQRADFAQTGYNMYGLKVHTRSECQERLSEAFVEEDMLVSAALSSQRALILEGIFDYPGIKAIEALPSPIVGALNGCSYTVMTGICDAWVFSKIAHANEEAGKALQKEKREWLERNEKASCKAAAKFGAPPLKPALPL